MFSERDELRLRDVIDNADAIAEYVNGMSFDDFAKDRRTIDAVERCLQRITEAVIQIGEDTMKRAAPGIPFAMVRGMGNKLRHEYHRIDARQIYVTAQEELPPLRSAISAALAE